MKLFRKSRPATAPEPWPVDLPLLDLPTGDRWTLRDAFEGVQIFGETGSGKTSGSGQALARSFLAAGMGGLVLTVKPDEADLWRSLAAKTGAESRLLVVSPGSGHRLNFLDYEYRRPGGGRTENIVDLFHAVLEALEGESGRSSDSYWERAVRQLLRNAVDLVAVAEGRVSLSSLKEAVVTAASSPDERDSASWQEASRCFRFVHLGDWRLKTGEARAERRRDFEEASRYWLAEFPGLSDKTRSVVVSSFTSMADGLLRGDLHDMFCTDTTFTPELSREGRVIVLDLPVKQWGQVGRSAQLLFKHAWQCAVERQAGTDCRRPVFLWADEAQFFLSPRDLDFQTTARSSRACTVYLTQNLPNYFTKVSRESMVRAFLGNLGTKIFHANTDPATNEWAADVIARSWQSRATVNTSEEQRERKDRDREGYSVSQSLEHDVIPQTFTHLRKGGDRHDRKVDAILFQGGRPWANGKTHLRLTFRQDLP